MTKSIRRKAKKHMLNEKYVTSKDKPESLIWVNGTTDKRFDMGKNVFRDISNPSEAAKLSPLNPCYLTSDISYAFKYIQGHITTDYRDEVGASPDSEKHEEYERSRGIVVFAKLKDGVKLFDFADEADFIEVFGEENGHAVAPLFH